MSLKRKISEFLIWLKDHFFLVLAVVVAVGTRIKENKEAANHSLRKEDQSDED